MTTNDEDEELEEIIGEMRWHRVLLYGAGCVLLLIFLAGGLNYMWYAFTPSDRLLEINNVDVEDTSDGDRTLHVKIDRTSHINSRGDATVEVNQIYKQGGKETLARFERRPFIEQGRQTVYRRYKLPDDAELEAGRYYVVVHISLKLPEGVTRTVTKKSEPFQVVPQNQSTTVPETNGNQSLHSPNDRTCIGV